jgi:osmotically-inducible protein OsmY
MSALEELRRDAVAEAAERLLRESPYAAVRSVTCDHRAGVLTLRGRVPSYYLKQLTQEAVARLEGVRVVENRVEVQAAP